MLFSTYEFILVFLPVTLALYYLLGLWSTRAANLWLLAASVFFYGWWDVRYVPLLAFSILWNYAAGLALARAEGKTVLRRVLLFLAVAVNLALLGWFKYADFFITTANRVIHTGWNLRKIILPLGISFYTFQAISYVADVYLGRTKAERSLLNLALYISLFPQLIAGPIVDHKSMIPQFFDPEKHRINWEKFSAGITLFSFALFKKIVIADSLSPVVAHVFSEPDTLTMLDAWIGVLSYSLQLYFDFSAYSEMAIGLGKMLNIDFPSNFDSPYQAVSMIDFWRRWHITLGSWIRNYIYIPLGGNRKGQARKMLNLFIAMAACGFWHGAGLKYIAWGMMHGGFLIVNHLWRAFAKERNLRLPKIASAVLTFACVASGWAVFRAGSLKSGFKIIGTMFSLGKFALPAGGKVENMFSFLYYFDVQFIDMSSYPKPPSLLVPLLMLFSVLAFCLPSAQKIVEARFKPGWKWLFITLCALFYPLYAIAGNASLSEFLYFQF